MAAYEESPYQIIAKFQQPPAAPPVDVDAIARALNINVYKLDLGRDISAQLVRDRIRGGSSGFAIYVNSGEAAYRQRFSVAHELAHYVLHRDLIESGVTDDTLYRSKELSSYLEVEANKMAADILMPIRLLKQSFQEIRRLSALAELFQVSQQAMEIRLKGIWAHPVLR